jgi:hypothetical protein
VSFADESLMAYVDGELDPQMRAAVAQAVTTDAEVARRVAQHRLLRASLQAAFAGVLETPVPEHLVRAARTGPAGANLVADPAGARAGRTAAALRLRRILPLWGALAASLVVGVVIGTRFLGGRGGELLVARPGSLLAQGALAQALADQLASAPTPNSTVQIGVSFRAHSGEYCRTFSLRESAESGLACHAAVGWRIDVLARNAPAESGTHGPAGSALPSAVSQVVDAAIAGEPLDANAERAARDQGWH